jgi:hypothetical protein
MNLCRAADGDWNLHWGNGPKLNHYTWIWTGRRTRFGREIRRPMTDHELRRPVTEWTSEQIARWRRGPKGGRKPADVAKRQRQARRRRVYIAWEIKTHDYGEADYAERVVATVERSGWPAFFMTLVTMHGWRHKMRAFHRAGGQTALLAHGAPRPGDLANWLPYIDRIWGRFARTT